MGSLNLNSNQFDAAEVIDGYLTRVNMIRGNLSVGTNCNFTMIYEVDITNKKELFGSCLIKGILQLVLCITLEECGGLSLNLCCSLETHKVR